MSEPNEREECEYTREDYLADQADAMYTSGELGPHGERLPNHGESPPAAGDVEAAAHELYDEVYAAIENDSEILAIGAIQTALRAARRDEGEKYKAEYSENDREAAVAIAREILIRNFDEETDEDWIEQFANDFADVFLGIIRSNRLACDMYQKERARVAELKAAGRKVCDWSAEDAIVFDSEEEEDLIPSGVEVKFNILYEEDLDALAALLNPPPAEKGIVK
uniref:Uncharacterized protein n=1 Tax=viral metagenome TaxID=1070528 RepID=A0A6M3LQW9_9ZZZZ